MRRVRTFSYWLRPRTQSGLSPQGKRKRWDPVPPPAVARRTWHQPWMVWLSSGWKEKPKTAYPEGSKIWQLCRSATLRVEIIQIYKNGRIKSDSFLELQCSNILSAQHHHILKFKIPWNLNLKYFKNSFTENRKIVRFCRTIWTWIYNTYMVFSRILEAIIIPYMY